MANSTYTTRRPDRRRKNITAQLATLREVNTPTIRPPLGWRTRTKTDAETHTASARTCAVRYMRTRARMLRTRRRNRCVAKAALAAATGQGWRTRLRRFRRRAKKCRFRMSTLSEGRGRRNVAPTLTQFADLSSRSAYCVERFRFLCSSRARWKISCYGLLYTKYLRRCRIIDL